MFRPWSAWRDCLPDFVVAPYKNSMEWRSDFEDVVLGLMAEEARRIDALWLPDFKIITIHILNQDSLSAQVR